MNTIETDVKGYTLMHNVYQALFDYKNAPEEARQRAKYLLTKDIAASGASASVVQAMNDLLDYVEKF